MVLALEKMGTRQRFLFKKGNFPTFYDKNVCDFIASFLPLSFKISTHDDGV